jgi:hypothetical protein
MNPERAVKTDDQINVMSPVAPGLLGVGGGVTGTFLVQ